MHEEKTHSYSQLELYENIPANGLEKDGHQHCAQLPKAGRPVSEVKQTLKRLLT